VGYTYEQKKIHGKDGTEITGFDGSARFLTIPEEIDGLPVLSIGSHAFSGRKELEEIRLPESVTKIGNFCFYDCSSLEELVLTGAVDDLGDGAIRECGALRNIDVTTDDHAFRVVKELMEDNPNELCFTIHVKSEEGRITDYRLVIPAWHHEDREDTHARAIHPKIAGAGYAYRQTVTRTELNIREYDSLFEKAQADGVHPSAKIALWRLACPAGLSEDARGKYVTWLDAHAGEVLQDLVAGPRAAESRDLLAVLLNNVKLPEDAVDSASDLAGKEGKTELCSMLMEYRNTHFEKPSAEIFEL
jgi:hypothetical protein